MEWKCRCKEWRCCIHLKEYGRSCLLTRGSVIDLRGAIIILSIKEIYIR